MTDQIEKPSTATVDAKRARLAARSSRRDTIAAYVFLTPYLILLAMFGIIPISYAFGLSFMDTITMEFWGLANYEFVFSDFRIPSSISNVLSYVGVWLAMTLLLVVALSLMLDNINRRSATIFRSIYFLPGAVTSSAVVVLWLFILDPSVSPFQPLLHLVGWEIRADVITGLTLPVVFAIMTYFSQSGGWIVVLGGSLSTVPSEVIEAARIDGANRFQLATRIKLPMIWRSVVLMGILCFAQGLQIFVEPQLMMLAGPQFAQNDWSLNQMVFQYAFLMGDFGASAALSVMLIGVSISIALIVIFATRFYKLD